MSAKNDPTRFLLLTSLILLFGFCETAGAQINSWTKIKGPYQGNVSAVVADAHGYVYAATQFGGVFTSSDSGLDWQQTNNGLNWSLITAFAIDSSGVVYAGGAYTGLYKTTDHATSWKRTSLPGAAVTAEVLPDGRLCVGGNDTVSISTDGGATWISSRVTGGTVVPVITVAMDRQGNIYAGLEAFFPNNHPPFGGGVFVSSDSGATWSYLGDTLVSIRGIQVSRSGRVFISNGYTVFSAPPNDSTWIQDAIGLPHDVLSSLSEGKAGEVVAACAGGVYTFDESGDAWDFTGSGLEYSSVTSACYNAGGKSFAGTERNGIFVMTDQQTGWLQCGISPGPATAVGVDKSGQLYVGSSNGIYKPSGQEGIWKSSSNGLLNGTVYAIDTLANLPGVFAVTSGGLFYSIDSGDYWSVNTARWTYDISQSPFDNSLYAVTTNGVQVSTGWENWAATNSIGLPISTIYSVLADQAGRVYAGTADNGVFVSTDRGNFWSQTGISIPFMFCSVKALAQATSLIGLNNGQWFTSEGAIYAGTDTAGAFYTDDYGTDWTHIPSITARNVTCFLLKPQVIPPYPALPPRAPPIYAGTLDGGVFVSTNSGISWSPMNTGLADSSVSSLALDPQGYLYAATDGGVYRTSGPVLEISPSKSVPTSFSLEQNFPNPFNPTTVISYKLLAVSHVSLKVYDVLGRVMTTLVDQDKQPGQHAVTFNGSKLASGVYFYRIVVSPVSADGETPAFIQTKKMVLLK